MFKLLIKILRRELEYSVIKTFITAEEASKLRNSTSRLKILRIREKLILNNKKMRIGYDYFLINVFSWTKTF